MKKIRVRFFISENMFMPATSSSSAGAIRASYFPCMMQSRISLRGSGCCCRYSVRLDFMADRRLRKIAIRRQKNRVTAPARTGISRPAGWIVAVISAVATADESVRFFSVVVVTMAAGCYHADNML